MEKIMFDFAGISMQPKITNAFVTGSSLVIDNPSDIDIVIPASEVSREFKERYSNSRTDKEGAQLYGDCTVHSTYRIGPINIIVVHDRYLEAWKEATTWLRSDKDRYSDKQERVELFNRYKRKYAEGFGEDFNA